MDEEAIHGNLINAIKQRFPQEKNLANILMDILFLGKESMYRRIRGEVPFTLFEVATIAKKLDLSMDNILGTATNGNRPFQLVLTDHIDPSIKDLDVQKHYVNYIRLVGNDLASEIGCATNVIPLFISYKYPVFSRLYAFKHAYLCDGIDALKPFSQVHFSKKLIEQQMGHYEATIDIERSYYILDNLIFSYIVNDVKYFSSIQMIEKEEVMELKEDLLKLINDLENLAIKGHFESGKPVQFYISNINFDAAYSYICSQNYGLSMINVFTLDCTSSFDDDTFEKIKHWIQSMKRCATLISESGEMQRVNFFKKQRELVETLDTCFSDTGTLTYL